MGSPNVDKREAASRTKKPLGIFRTASSLQETLSEVHSQKYGFIVTTLTNDHVEKFSPPSDLVLESYDWSRFVVAYVRGDYFDKNSRQTEQFVSSQLSYSAHLGLSTNILGMPYTRRGVADLARVVNARIVHNMSAAGYWIEVPLNLPNVCECRDGDSNDAYREYSSSWNQWNDLRMHVTYDKRVGIALDLKGDLPNDDECERWSGEPIRALTIRTREFLTNKQGYPVLSKAYQSFIRKILESTSREVFLIVKGPVLHGDSYRFYSTYLEHLRGLTLPNEELYSYAKGYEDFLQYPLQPLQDNLESSTYEVFERDPIKYREYQRAIELALNDIEAEEDGFITVMVVGAGRGPLVEAAARAAETVQKRLRIYVVEKNPNAIITLRSLLEEKWSTNERCTFTLISSDMREFVCPHKADLVVSELLGSFSDNELSPECLDGVYASVKNNAISIPQSYTSYMHPVMSSRIYTELIGLRNSQADKPYYTPFEFNYVAFIRNAYRVGKPQEVFTFNHFDLHNPPSSRDNSRTAFLSFTNSVDYVCHGFAGYFTTVLYKTVELSTNPETATYGMFSWFPIYIPIIDPVLVRANEKLSVTIWRLISASKVWYEWGICEPHAGTMHNSMGRSHAIGLH